MSLVRIDSSHISVGDTTPWVVYDLKGGVLLGKGVKIRDERQLSFLFERGHFKDDSADDLSSEPGFQMPQGVGHSTFLRGKRFELSPTTPVLFQSAELLLARLDDLLVHVLRRDFERLNQRVEQFSKDLQTSFNRDQDVFLAALQLHGAAPYPLLHALHSAVLCELIGAEKGLFPDQRILLMSAALMRDIAFLDLQALLDEQRAPLSAEQKRLVWRHPADSHSMLVSAGFRDQELLDAVRHHHERLDGSGYPDGLKGDEILQPARVLAIADIYSAMTKRRSYRDAHLGNEALRDIFLSRGASVDGDLAQLFVRILGIYPPGIHVRLATGEFGVVTRRTGNARCPDVKAVLDPGGRVYPVYPQRDLSDPANAIVEIVPRTRLDGHRLNYQQLWGRVQAR